MKIVKIISKLKKLNFLDLVSFIYLKNIFKIKRIIYGLFYEKKWVVLTSKRNSEKFNCINYFKNLNYKNSSIKHLPINRDYTFYADPFILKNKLLVEALEKKKSGKGKILSLSFV